MRSAATLLTLMLAACSLETERATCPCLEGYSCCARTNRCIAAGEVCEAVPRKWTKMVSGTTEHLRGIWGSSSTDIHVVGIQGFFHYDGKTWSPMPAPPTAQMLGLFGFDRSHVIAFGENGTILNYNGSTWTPMDPGVPNTITGVWGPSFDDTFAVGTGGTIIRFDGTAWTPFMDPTIALTLLHVWGTDSKNVLVVGMEGRIFRHDGSRWSSMTSGVTSPLLWTWGRGPDDIYAGGETTLLRFDGKTWTSVPDLPPAAVTYDACGDLHEIFAVGEIDTAFYKVPGEPGSLVFYHDGTRWSRLDPPTRERLSAVWCKDGEVFIVGHYGTILRYGP